MPKIRINRIVNLNAEIKNLSNLHPITIAKQLDYFITIYDNEYKHGTQIESISQNSESNIFLSRLHVVMWEGPTYYSKVPDFS